MTVFDLSQTDSLLTTTRSVRQRLDLNRSVPPEIVVECIRIAPRSPSAGGA